MNKEATVDTEECGDFESALSRLEDVVSALENGSSGLEESLRLFEEGVGLIRVCDNKLNQAEQKVKKLVLNKSGDYDEQDFTQAE